MAKRKRKRIIKAKPAKRVKQSARVSARSRQVGIPHVPILATTDELLRTLLGAYDVARTTNENRRHWAQADNLAADAANTPAVLKALRSRARYEHANNSYCSGIVATVANDCIGTGPRLQLAIPDAKGRNNKRLAKFVENEWAKWCVATRLMRKLRLARRTRAHSGEVFLLKHTNKGIGHAVKLDVRVYEPDQVATPGFSTGDGKIDGIVLDADGNPETYHLLKEHPGVNYLTSESASKINVPADEMIHWFEIYRPGQHRGIPEITPALPLFAILRRYTMAVLESAETAASLSVIAHTTYLPNDAAAAVDDYSLDIERNTMTFLPEGWDLTQLKAEQPTAVHTEYVKSVLSEMARCLSMPYSIAACDSSGSNMASGLLDQKTYYKAVRIDRAEAEVIVLYSLFLSWLEEAVKVYKPLKIFKAAYKRDWSWAWMWPKLGEHGDPAKVARGRETDLKTGSTNLANVHASEGRDWEDELETTLRVRRAQVDNDIELAKYRKEKMEAEGLSDADVAPVESSRKQQSASMPAETTDGE